MSYQNINQYVFRKLFLSPVAEISDISLASDEKDYDKEVIFSDEIIANNDGNRMPFKFDINSSDTIECVNCGDFDRDVIVSENYWNPDNIDVNLCPITTELCDIGLTGIDNGLVKNISGETIEVTTGLYLSDSDKFSRYKYDRRLKLHPITGFTTPENRIFNDDSYTYNLTIENDSDDVGDYLKLDGGFYQGFYKLSGYDYEVFPTRPHYGWSAEFLLRYRWTGNTDVGLNYRYPDNKGTFFYIGARAENKYYHYADGHPKCCSGYTRVTEGLNCMETCGCASSANTSSVCNKVYQQSGVTSTNCSCGQCPCSCTVTVSLPEKNPLYDEVSNALSVRLSGDTGSPKVCVKTFRITGGCETSGTCTTGITYTTGVTVNEWCSSKGIFDDCIGYDYINEEHWVQIDAVFERNLWLDKCDLVYKGGLGLIVSEQYTATSANNSVSLIEPPLTHYPYEKPATVEVVNMNDQWIQEQKYRLGKFKIFVNGRLFMIVDNFEEIIPRPLNTLKETQLGVAYNISLGGGTQGLHDNLTLISCSGLTYQQDPECLPTDILNQTIYSGLTTNIHLEKYFGGSFIGDVSSFRMYTEPMNAAQIKHNYKILKDRYNLLSFDCLDCGIKLTPTPTQTPTLTNTPTLTQTPTNTGVYYYYFLLSCDGSNNKIGRSSTNGLTGVYNISGNTCYEIVGIDFGTYYDYDLDLYLLVSDCLDFSCLGPTPTITTTETPTNTPTPSETPTETPTQTPTNTNTPTPSPTDLSLITTYIISGCSTLNVFVADLLSPNLVFGDVFSTLFTGGTPTGCYTVINKIDETSIDTIVSLTFYLNCEDCESTITTPTPTQTNTPSETPTNTPSETPTETPTNTPSETPTNTPSETPTNTPSETPTNTPSQTQTQTQTPTNTPTPSTTPSLVTSGLIIQLDAYTSESYPGSGTTVINMINPGTYNHTLIGATFTTLNTIKCFDCTTGTNRVVVNGTGPTLPTTGYTYITWARLEPNPSSFRTLLYTNSPKYTPITVPNETNTLGYWDTAFRSSGYDLSGQTSVWVQYAVVGTNSSQKFYINGSEVGSQIAFGAGGTAHWGWGNNDIVPQAWGCVANMYFYDRQLSLSEIQQQYSFLAPRFV